jgi:hypothetical protein
VRVQDVVFADLRLGRQARHRQAAAFAGAGEGNAGARLWSGVGRRRAAAVATLRRRPGAGRCRAGSATLCRSAVAAGQRPRLHPRKGFASASSIASSSAGSATGSIVEPAADQAALLVGARPQRQREVAQCRPVALPEAELQGAQPVEIVAHAERHAIGQQFPKQAQEQRRQADPSSLTGRLFVGRRCARDSVRCPGAA